MASLHIRVQLCQEHLEHLPLYGQYSYSLFPMFCGSFPVMFFVGLWTVSSLSVLSSYISIRFPYHKQITSDCLIPSPLIPYHHYRRLSLALSSGTFLITLSLWFLLSCMIHQPTKQYYCTLGLCPLALVVLPARCCLRVYNLYQYSTWTLSLSSCTIRTSELEP